MPLSFIEGGRPETSKYLRVIETIKSKRLGLHGVIKATNLKQTQVKVILADLVEQGIAVEVLDGKSKKYEFRFGSQPLDTRGFEALRQAKLAEFDQMLNYTAIEKCRMKFLCDFLGDTLHDRCGKCDNCRGKKITVSISPEWRDKITRFRETYFPVLETQYKGTTLVNGVAASYYGVSNVGQTLHRCKYENGGDFPDWLLRLTLKAFHRHYGKEKFDVVLYVPPTESGDLVRNFAVKVAASLGIPVSHNLKKSRATRPQKVFQTGLLKTDNLKGAFMAENPNEIAGKSVLLIDDIYDSGATVKEVGSYLSKLGAAKVAPLVIAKTVSGDL